MLCSAQPGVITASSACLAKNVVFWPLREISRLSLTLGEQYIGLSDYGSGKALKADPECFKGEISDHMEPLYMLSPSDYIS